MVRVFDGDTLLLAGGTRVRLAGIDAPEIAHDDHPAEPFGREATSRLQALVDRADGRVHLHRAARDHDHYGRLLAHVYGRDGRSLQADLLERGLALVMVYPPNLQNLPCYREAQAAARDRHAGLWRLPPLRSTALKGHERGFVRMRGRVRRIHDTHKSRWIDLVGGVSLRIARDDLRYFPTLDTEHLRGHTLEARGWLTRTRGRARIRIRHPAALTLDPPLTARP